ncbi:MAG: PorV/PorQ family protein [Elusimicrobia bacterium]|nr:PorV/PorQ family protein [Elusimicrobiota bacterium]
MNRNIIKKISVLSTVTLLLFCFTIANCFSETTGASFLNIGIGARPIGMGSAFTAVATDVTAIHWNPAGLAQLSKREISAMHTEWLVDTKLDFISYAHPLKSGVVAGSVIYLSQGEIEGRDVNRQRTNPFSANDLAVTLSYSKVMPELSKSLSAGLNLKIIQQNIENHTAQGVAIDLGTLYQTPINNLKAGLSIQNIGPQMKFISEGYNLPLTVTAGLGYTISAITVAVDIKQQIYEGRTIVSVGTEYCPVNILALRAGYAGKLIEGVISNKDIITQDNIDKTNFTGFGAGLGLKLFTNYQMDYSFVPYGLLGDTHRISFSARF